MVEFRNLQPREAWIYSTTLPPMKIKTIDVRPGVLRDEFMPRRIERLNQASPYVIKRDAAREAMKERMPVLVDQTSPQFDPADDGLGH